MATRLAEHAMLLPDVFYADPYNHIRRQRGWLIGCCLMTHQQFAELPRARRDEILTLVECSCFEYACAMASKCGCVIDWNLMMFENIYDTIAFRVQKHIETSTMTPDPLVARLCTDNDFAARFASIPSHELRPEHTFDIRESIRQQREQKIEEKYSTQYGECQRCGQAKAKPVLVHARSLDEGATLWIYCMTEGCGASWKRNC
jgi:DNA-directed RNA polymerase subunit M/transcription elongation factor TFIIS